MKMDKWRQLPSAKKQQLHVEFAHLADAGLQGIYMSLTPGNATLWTGVIFVRRGPYASAILRVEVHFPPTYPYQPPQITFKTDIFHPLVMPSTTYSHGFTAASDLDAMSAAADDRLPSGGVSLRHCFPRSLGSHKHASTLPSPTWDSVGSRSSAGPDPMPVAGAKESMSVIDALRYIRSTLDDEKVLDAIPLAAAANHSAWYAWQAHRGNAAVPSPRLAQLGSSPGAGRSPADWNWEGVWVERATKGVRSSRADSVLYGHVGGGQDVVRFVVGGICPLRSSYQLIFAQLRFLDVDAPTLQAIQDKIRTRTAAFQDE
ncbi:MAG: hypothetical protein M1826_000495 [Phylliscum demangeonii]|nr:MAG: hypothetical protein M1826_000495 [Phylliscum demangeonii]